MPVSSLTVTVKPDSLGKVRSEIKERFGGTVGEPIGNCLVVVLESDSNKEMKEKVDGISQLKGVMLAQLAFYNEEDLHN